MKELYLIVYMIGQIAGFVGPGVDTEKCANFVSEFQVSKSKALETGLAGDGSVLTNAQKTDLANMTVVCEYRTEKPVIERD